MPPEIYYTYGVAAIVVISVLSLLALLFVLDAPYGRHGTDGGWGPRINGTLGWVVMEAPSPLLCAWFFFHGQHWASAAPLTLFTLYQVHYVYRAFIFPMRRRGAKREPLWMVGAASIFNVANGTLIGWSLGHVGTHLAEGWVTDPRFLLGVALFCWGYFVNHQSDAILMNLRAPGETGYKIPQGGLYHWVSSPNYLGELIEWTGFAIAAWTGAAWAFALMTLSNLLPRALANHRWYHDKFDDYPKERRALFPFVL